MLRPRSLVAAALLASLPSIVPAASTKGFIRIAGIQGPVKDAQHHHWSDLASSDITIDMTPGEECKVLADAVTRHAAPGVLARVGDVVAEVEIELVMTVKGDLTTFNALLEDVTFNRVTTSSLRGQQVERLDMSPERIEIETREIKADGQLGNPQHFSKDCGGGRLP